MFKMIGVATMLFGAAGIALLFWLAATEGAAPKPFSAWPVKAYALLAVPVVVFLCGFGLTQARIEK